MEPSHEQQARSYLADHFPAAVRDLHEVARFDSSPLEGDGAVTLFGFTGAPAGGDEQSYVVVAGETEPNYYPAWNLEPDEIFSLHLGTRFMLVVGVAQAPETDAPEKLDEQVNAAVAAAVPGEQVTELRTVAVFRADEQRHVVARGRIAGDDVYVLGGDIAVGLSRRIDLPPHVAYRIHLGNVIRIEPEES